MECSAITAEFFFFFFFLSVTCQWPEDVVVGIVLTAVVQGCRWMKQMSGEEGRRWRGGEEKRGEWWAVAVGRVTARLQMLFTLFISSRRFTPFPPQTSSSPSFSLRLHSPPQITDVFFQYSLSAANQWLISCLLPGLSAGALIHRLPVVFCLFWLYRRGSAQLLYWHTIDFRPCVCVCLCGRKEIKYWSFL